MKTLQILTAFVLFFFLQIATPVFGQMYYDDGRLICCGSAVAALSTNAAFVNPAGLGGATEITQSLNLLQPGFTAYGNSIERKDALKFLFSNAEMTDTTKGSILGNMANNGQGNFLFDGNVNMNWVAYALTHPKYGGISFNLTEKITSRTNLNPQTTELLLNGNQPDPNNPDSPQETPINLSKGYGLGNSDIYYHHVREANLAYGRQIVTNEKFQLRVGATLNRIWGVGHLDINVQDSVVTGTSSFADLYNINYGTLDSVLGDFSKNLFKTAGHGTAYSLGIQMKYKKLNVGLTTSHVGAIKWKHKSNMTVNSEVPADSVAYSGIDSYNFSSQADGMYQLFGFQPGQTFSSSSNGKLRFNADYQIIDQLSVFSDVLLYTHKKNNQKLPNNYLAGLSYQLIPDKFIITAGAQYNQHIKLRYPVGIAFAIGKGAFLSVSTGDVKTLISKKAEPYSSLSVSLIGLAF
jgi:hypothetical protein